MLIYLGWPEARETDAERAVRAGLAVAAAVSAAPIGQRALYVRIGTATGLVVIGEPISSGDSRQHTAIGETPNLAARLLGLAGPDQVVIDAATRRQICGLFDCHDLRPVELKGLPAWVPAWQVLSENRTLGSRSSRTRPRPNKSADRSTVRITSMPGAASSQPKCRSVQRECAVRFLSGSRVGKIAALPSAVIGSISVRQDVTRPLGVAGS